MNMFDVTLISSEGHAIQRPALALLAAFHTPSSYSLGRLRVTLVIVLILWLSGCSSSKNSPLPSFQWPPPTPSARFILPTELITPNGAQPQTFKSVDARLTAALNALGYSDRSYFAIPGGFALVTRMERIKTDGTSEAPPNRWALEYEPMNSFSFSEYLSRLFYANPGRFRLIVFAVTSESFTADGSPVDKEEALDWLNEGANKLPSKVASTQYTDDHSVTALIYEFEKPDGGSPSQKQPSSLTGKDHLEKSGLWQTLNL